jgi:hypothetical protein
MIISIRILVVIGEASVFFDLFTDLRM